MTLGKFRSYLAPVDRPGAPLAGFLRIIFVGIWTYWIAIGLPYRYESVNQMFPPEQQVKNAWNTR